MSANDHTSTGRASRHSRRGRKSRALITDASYTPEQNRQSREKQYAVLQGLRLPFIVAAVAAAWANWWVLAGILFVVSVPLPWIAVVRGNAQGEVRDTTEECVQAGGGAPGAADAGAAATHGAGFGGEGPV